MRYSIVLLLVMILSSCEDGIRADLPRFDYKKEIVLYGNLSPQRGLFLEVVRTIDPAVPTPRDDVYLSEATVQVWDNDGNLLGTAQYSSEGIYVLTDIEIIPLEEYNITATHPDYEDARVHVRIPPSIPLFNCTTKEVKFSNFSFREEINLHLLMDLEVTEAEKTSPSGDYYRLAVFRDSFLTFPIGYSTTQTINLPQADPVLCGLGSVDIVLYGDPQVYRNGCRNTLSYQRVMELYSDQDYWGTEEGEYLKSASIYFYISQVDQDYVDFSSYFDPEEIDLLFVKKEKIFTNVDGGQGVVIGTNYRVLRYDIDFEAETFTPHK